MCDINLSTVYRFSIWNSFEVLTVGTCLQGTFVYKEQAVNPLVIARRLMFVLTKQLPLLLLFPTEVWAKHLHTALKTDCCWGRTFSYRPLEFGCWGLVQGMYNYF